MIPPPALLLSRHADGSPDAGKMCGAGGARDMCDRTLCNVATVRAGRRHGQRGVDVPRWEVGMHRAGAIAADSKIPAATAYNVATVRGGRQRGRPAGTMPQWGDGIGPAWAIAADSKIPARTAYNVATVRGGRPHGQRIGSVPRWGDGTGPAGAIAAASKIPAGTAYNVATVRGGRPHGQRAGALLRWGGGTGPAGAIAATSKIPAGTACNVATVRGGRWRGRRTGAVLRRRDGIGPAGVRLAGAIAASALVSNSMPCGACHRALVPVVRTVRAGHRRAGGAKAGPGATRGVAPLTVSQPFGSLRPGADGLTIGSAPAGQRRRIGPSANTETWLLGHLFLSRLHPWRAALAQSGRQALAHLGQPAR